MNAGDAFHINGEGFEGHLWVVVSDPALSIDDVVIMNITTWEPCKGNDCELFDGDHPFIDRKSTIFWADAQVVPLSALEAWRQSGILSMHAIAFSEDILKKIRAGAATTKRLPFYAKSVLSAQGII